MYKVGKFSGGMAPTVINTNGRRGGRNKVQGVEEGARIVNS